MNILKENTSPQFEIVPRYNLDVSRVFKFKITNENTDEYQEILADAFTNENENYTVIMDSFPLGNSSEKLSYVLVDNLTNKIVTLGKMMIVSETENIQDYTKQSNTKFYE